jgi:hypothetical protein
MTKNEKAHLEANYKMHVDKALAAKAKAQKNPDDKDLAARERAHWNIVYGYAMAAVTVLSLTVEEDEAYVIVSAWRKEATDEYERGVNDL